MSRGEIPGSFFMPENGRILSRKWAVHGLVSCPLFCYHFPQKEGVEMESYDNDGLLLFLDDDLFPVEPEEDERVDRVE